MKVTVKDNYLNLRTGLPSVNAPNTSYLSPGDVIETDGKLYRGDTYEGNNLWMKDLAGNYLWSGGVQSVLDGTTSDDQWWYETLKIGDIKKQLLGKFSPINIAVLDTGLIKNEDVLGSFNIIGKRNFLDGTENVTDLKHGHGTLCASLIAANHTSLSGINPNANLFIGKTVSDRNTTNATILANAIDYLANGAAGYSIDIISISGGMEYDANLSALETAVKNAFNKGIIIIAAIGNLIETTAGNYPALYNHVISVGGLNAQSEYSSTLNPPVSKIDILFPGENIIGLNYYKCASAFNGTSHACALAAGISSLVISKVKHKQLTWSQKELLAFLKKSSESFIKNVGQTGQTFYKINGALLLSNLNQI